MIILSELPAANWRGNAKQTRFTRQLPRNRLCSTSSPQICCWHLNGWPAHGLLRRNGSRSAFCLLAGSTWRFPQLRVYSDPLFLATAIEIADSMSNNLPMTSESLERRVQGSRSPCRWNSTKAPARCTAISPNCWPCLSAIRSISMPKDQKGILIQLRRQAQ